MICSVRDDEGELSAINCPRLYIHGCKNLRFATATWTGKDGKHGACKDFVDVARYFCFCSADIFGSDSAILDSGGTY